MQVLETILDGQRWIAKIMDHHAEESLVAFDFHLELLDLGHAQVTQLNQLGGVAHIGHTNTLLSETRFSTICI